MKRPKRLSTSSAYTNLFNRAAYIRRGHKLTQREEKRARDALEILARTPTKKYEAFIHEVAEENAASQLAVLFAIEIGCQISKVLSQQTCRELPVLLKENAATLKSNALQSIVKEIEADSQKISEQDAGIQDPMPASLTGYAYEFKIEDALQIPLPGEVAGKIRLTVPYDGIMPPFLTIPITLKIAGEYMSKGTRVM